jgi:hypothetical protein
LPPLETTGLVPVTLVTVPPLDGLVLVIVKLGYVPLVDIPVPAVNTTVWSGAVFVIVSVPLVVIGLPVTLIPVLATAATLVTVPKGLTAHDVSVPSVVRYLPELPVWLGARALNARLAVT